VRGRRRSRSRLIGILLLLSSVLILGVVVWYSTARYDGAVVSGMPALSDLRGQPGAETPAPVTPTPSPTPTPVPIPADLPLTARAALVIVVETGDVLFERDADEPLQPASTIKIVTALTVLKHATPEEVITIHVDDVVDPVEESSMGLRAGDTVTIHDLLVGLLLPSGNDAAKALARHVGERLPPELGHIPQERFVAGLNVVARELGMDGSILVHPAGHDREGQAITARDLAQATIKLLERPALMPIVAMEKAEVRVGGDHARVLTLSNTNELLTETGVHGIKTGTTLGAGQCLVVAYRDGERTLVAVILGSTDRYTDARALLDLPEPPPSPEGESDDDAP
jgi:serine-type D-Ala-D-Ala carboxypeptidase (penicillin-binding protein 5/6)